MLLKENILEGVEDHRYNVKIAQTDEDVLKAQTLRYRVFGAELNRNFEFVDNLDQDEYDEQYHHLIVIDKKTGEAIGTYRLQTYAQAKAGRGFKSSMRFEINQLPLSILQNAFEVGRVCVLSEHRNGRVLFLLWKGLAGYLKHFDCRYLFGYLALHTEHPAIAMNTYRYFQEHNHMHSKYYVDVKEGFYCSTHPDFNEKKEEVDVPPLFKNYLDIGCKICSKPSCCRKTKLIHFFILLDVQNIPDKYKNMFGV